MQDKLPGYGPDLYDSLTRTLEEGYKGKGLDKSVSNSLKDVKKLLDDAKSVKTNTWKSKHSIFNWTRKIRSSGYENASTTALSDASKINSQYLDPALEILESLVEKVKDDEEALLIISQVMQSIKKERDLLQKKIMNSVN